MSFDPLHKWLGIPPGEQPPNHYRLLGIVLYESDPEVIDAAADKQLSFLHDLTGGEHAEAAEDISNKVSLARLCLLDDKKRSVYDQTLRRNAGGVADSNADVNASSNDAAPNSNPTLDPISATTAEAVASLIPTAPATSVGADPVPASQVGSPVDAPVQVRSNRHPVSSRSVLSWGMITSLSGIVMLLLIGLAISQGHLQLDLSRLLSKFPTGNLPTPTEEPVSETTPASSTPSDDSEPIAQEQANTTTIENVVPVKPPSVKTEMNEVRDDASVAKTEPDSETESKPVSRPAPKPRRSLADLLHQPSAPPNASKPESSVDRAPLPSDSALDEKMGLVRELYQAQYRSAKNRQEKNRLGSTDVSRWRANGR